MYVGRRLYEYKKTTFDFNFDLHLTFKQCDYCKTCNQREAVN